MKRVLVAGMGIGVALVTGAGSCGTSTSKASSPAKTVATIPPVSPTTKATAPPTTAAPAAPATLLDVSGNGEKTTEPFTAKGPWHLKYSYDCANFGQSGNFAVEISGGDGLSDQGPNTEGMSGSDTNYEPKGGTFSLQVLSECSWHVVVTG